MKMYAIFFWILAFLWLIGVFVPDGDPARAIFVNRGRNILILAMLILLGLKVYPFNG